MRRIINRLLVSYLIFAFLFYGCATNPVTGKQELHLISESYEIKVGEDNYLYTQQSQGGDYLTDPELIQYVKDVGHRLSQVSDRPQLPFEFVIINSSVPNAWALPGGKIAINRGLLLELDNEAELAAVLGHEIVHATARHGAKSMERGLLMNAALIGLSIYVASSDYSQYQNAILGAAGLGTTLIGQKYSRGAELEADFYGMHYMSKAGFDPTAAVGLQQTFVRLADNRQPNWLEGLFSSHPPSQERVDANMETAKSLRTDGLLGRGSYQEQITVLREQTPGYEAVDEGYKAILKKQYRQAIQFADTAIRIVPRESLGYALRAAANTQMGRTHEAVQDYDQAIQQNDRYFRHYLERGLLKKQMGLHYEASADLERSVKYLPTAVAQYSLGDLALANNDMNKAITHFRAASEAKNELGQKARIALARLEMPQKPLQYLNIQVGPDQAGSLLLRVTNKSPVTLDYAVFYITAPDIRGRMQNRTLYLHGALTPGNFQILSTNILVGSQQAASQAQVRIGNVRVR
ncbi:MAG TPA: M48 family metalloprotease [Deltaproteobacteria bacterium]|nr:M48 family metalloprotease [Deltaproteobacteria bacterium]